MKSALFLIATSWALPTAVGAANPCAKLPFQLMDNRIFLETKINGAGPYQFILDTGSSSNVVDTAVARELSLPLTDPFPIGGAGPNQQMGYHTKVQSITLDSIAVDDPDTVAVPTENVRKAIGFRHFDGIIGARFFEEHFVEIDYAQRVLTACPASQEFSGAGQIIPLLFTNGSSMPSVMAKVDGTEGEFLLDTGDRTTLTVFENFSKQNRVEENYAKIINVITGEGVGGPIRADVLRLRSFDLGIENFQNFPTRFPLAKDFSVDGFAGNLGNGLLKTHHLIFDYQRKRMILLEPSGFGYQDYDRSGLWLVTRDDGVHVADVVTGSAAWRSGLTPGDILLDVDGVALDWWALPQLRLRLSSPRVQNLAVRVSRNGQPRDVVLSLFDLI